MKIMGKKILIDAVHCERRFIDAKKIQNYFEKNGYRLVKKPKEADIIFFFTCTVIDCAVNLSLYKIKKYQEFDAELIVAGCLPDVEKEKLKKIFNGRIISTKNLDKIDNFFPTFKVKFKEINDANEFYYNFDNTIFSGLVITKLMSYLISKFRPYYVKNNFDTKSHIYLYTFKNPYYIRISWGCIGNCSYCSIKDAVGEYKSKHLVTILEEFKEGLNKGFKNFVLTADNLGPYGTDIKENLPNLLKKIVNLPKDFNIYIHALDPRWLIKYEKEIFELLKSGKIINIDIPIQSGSSKILKLMNRYSDIEKIKEFIKKINKKYPRIVISTHLIAGFPSETSDDFNQTIGLVKNCDFNSVIILPYSSGSNTVSEDINKKISKKEINRRLKKFKNEMKKLNYKGFLMNKNPTVNYIKKKKRKIKY
jgi:tRNA A37 methylthiotransferase MiaB